MQESKLNTPIVKPIVTSVKFKNKINVHIPTLLLGKFAAIHRSYPDNEWSGLLFYKFTGSVQENNIEIFCKDFVLMDLGSAAYTEFDMTSNYMEYWMDIDPEFEMQYCLIHSHAKMKTFYSGKDQSVFEETAELYNFFPSIVVNHYSDFYGKVGSYVEEDFTITGNKLIKENDGNLVKIPYTNTIKRKVLYEWECEFVVENPYKDRIIELKAEKAKKAPEVFYHPKNGLRNLYEAPLGTPPSYGGKHYNSKLPSKQFSLFEDDLDNKEFVLDTKFINELLVELFGEASTPVRLNPRQYVPDLDKYNPDELLQVLDYLEFPYENPEILEELGNYEPKVITSKVKTIVESYLKGLNLENNDIL